MGRHVQRLAPSDDFKVCTPEQELALFRAQHFASLEKRHQPDTAAASQLRWIIGGILFGLTMLCSFAWNALRVWTASMERQAERSHELAMAAVKSTPAASGVTYSPEFVVVVGVVLAALLLIAIGAARR